MKTYGLVLFSFLWIFFSCLQEGEGPSVSSVEGSFSFDEILSMEEDIQMEAKFLEADDGVKISYYDFSAEDPQYALVFLHGGGAHGLAGYQYFAKSLSESHGISVYLMDLRGHGLSEGPRGDSPTREQPWLDLSRFLAQVSQENPRIPLLLGGHSSGGGMLLNFISELEHPEVEAYFFISPELGYKSETAREDIDEPFAEVNVDLFVQNAMSGGKQAGNEMAVFFNYPPEVLEDDPLIVSSLTVNMSNSMTPDSPQWQFRDIEKPFALFVGSDDELFVPEKVMEYHSLPDEEVVSRSIWGIVEDANHLSVLLVTDQLILNALEVMDL